jgi:hypothetical protein
MSLPSIHGTSGGTGSAGALYGLGKQFIRKGSGKEIDPVKHLENLTLFENHKASLHNLERQHEHNRQLERMEAQGHINVYTAHGKADADIRTANAKRAGDHATRREFIETDLPLVLSHVGPRSFSHKSDGSFSVGAGQATPAAAAPKAETRPAPSPVEAASAALGSPSKRASAKKAPAKKAAAKKGASKGSGVAAPEFSHPGGNMGTEAVKGMEIATEL